MTKDFFDDEEVTEIETTDVEVIETEKVGMFKRAKNAVVDWAHTPKTPIENAKTVGKVVLGLGLAVGTAFGIAKAVGSKSDDGDIVVYDLNDPDSYDDLISNDNVED